MEALNPQDIQPGDFAGLYRFIGREVGGSFCPVEGFTLGWRNIHASPRLYELAMTLNPPAHLGWVFWNDPRANELRKAFGEWSDSSAGGLLVSQLIGYVRLGWESTVKAHVDYEKKNSRMN